MKLREIVVDLNQKLFDTLQAVDIELVLEFYKIYDTHYRRTSNFSFDPYRFYSPAEVIDIIDYLETVSPIITQSPRTSSQIITMLNDLTSYFNS